jgi:hypothetical protein
MYTFRSVFLSIAVAGVLAGPAVAKVAPATLAELVAWSDLIVVAHVTQVSGDPNEPYAIVAVDERWHGSSEDNLRISLHPTWPCDGSRAVLGEHVVLFLDRSKDGQWHIGHSGHGRMPIASNRASVSPMVLLPGETNVRGVDHDVPLEELHRMVTSKLKRVAR